MAQCIATTLRRHGACLLLSVTFAAPGLAPALAQPAFARRTEENARAQYIAERNMLGLVQFCLGRGLVGEDVLATQRQVVDGLHGPQELGAAEEAEGRRGAIAFMAPQAALTESAQAQGMTIKTKCEQLGLTILR